MPVGDGTDYLSMFAPPMQEEIARRLMSNPNPHPGTGAWSVMGAAMRRESLFVAIPRLFRGAFDDIPRDPGYNVFRDDPNVFTEFPEFHDRFAASESARETSQVRESIQQELADLETLDRAGVGGIFAMIAAGIISPENVLPLGWGIRAARGGRFIKSVSAIAEGTAAGLTGAAIAEGTLQISQETRRRQESIINMAGAAALGGILGGFSATSDLIKPGVVQRHVEKFISDPNDVIQFRESLPTVREARGMTTEEHVQAIMRAGNEIDPALTTVFQSPLFGGRFLRKVLNMPGQRVLKSDSGTVRVAGARIHEPSGLLESDVRGVGQGPQAETIHGLRKGEAASSLRQMRQEYRKYVKRMKKDDLQPFPRRGRETAPNRYENGWNDLVYLAYIHRGKLPDHLEVDAATRTSAEQASLVYRRTFGEALEEQTRAAGHMTYPSQVSADPWYMPRVFNEARIDNRPQEFEDYFTQVFLRSDEEGTLSFEEASRMARELRNVFKDRYVTKGGLPHPATDLNLPPQFRERTLLLSTEDLAPWLVTDYEQIVSKLVQNVMSHNALSEAFNRIDIVDGYKGQMDLLDEHIARVEEAKSKVESGNKSEALEVHRATGDLRAYAALRSSPNPAVKAMATEISEIRAKVSELEAKAQPPRTETDRATGVKRLTQVEEGLRAPGELKALSKRLDEIYSRAKAIDGGVRRLEALPKDKPKALRALEREIHNARAAEAWRNSSLGDPTRGDSQHGIFGHATWELDELARKEFGGGRAQGGATSKINKQVEDLQLLRDRLLGTSHVGNPNTFWSQGGRILQRLNFVTKMGSVVLSSIPDIAMGAFVNGFRPYMKTYLAFMRPNLRSIAANKEELVDLLMSVNTMHPLHMARAGQLADLDLQGIPSVGPLSGTERVMSRVSDSFSSWILIDRWNALQQGVAGIMTLQRVVRQLPALLDGSLHKSKVATLASIGIDQRTGAVLKRFIDAFGESERRFGQQFTWARTQLWTDPDLLARKLPGVSVDEAREARDLLVGGVMKEVRRTIIEPGIGDRPGIMENQSARLILQFRSFSIAATQRVFDRGHQRLGLGDVEVLGAAMMSMSMGALAYFANQSLKRLTNKNVPDPLEQDTETWIREAVDRSGVIGLITDINAAMEGVSGGKVSMFPPFLGGQPLTRYQSRNFTDTLLGPSLGAAKDIESSLRSLFREEGLTGTDVKRGRRLVPFNNVFYLRNLFDIGQNAFIEGTGIPEDRRRKARF